MTVFFSAQAYAAELENTILIPNFSAGPLTSDSSEKMLLAAFPEGTLRHILYDEGEGMYRCATRFSADTNREMTIIWKSDKHIYEQNQNALKECEAKTGQAFPQAVIFINNPKKPSIWKTNEGISANSTLAALETANGRAVTFSICECDYGGNVMDWNEGKYPSSFRVNLEYATNLRPVLERYVRGKDKAVRSTDVPPEIKTNIFIHKILMEFD